MALADKAIGLLLTSISLSIFTYYTFWVIILARIISCTGIFFPKSFAILVLVFVGVALLSFLCVFVGYVMLKSKKKKSA